jgi:hypothetical protein
MIQYAQVIESKIARFSGCRNKYMSVHGYTRKGGCPTDYMIRLDGCNRWYRVMNYCTSNSGTLFVKTKECSFLVVKEEDIEYWL